MLKIWRHHENGLSLTLLFLHLQTCRARNPCKRPLASHRNIYHSFSGWHRESTDAFFCFRSWQDLILYTKLTANIKCLSLSPNLFRESNFRRHESRLLLVEETSFSSTWWWGWKGGKQVDNGEKERQSILFQGIIMINNKHQMRESLVPSLIYFPVESFLQNVRHMTENHIHWTTRERCIKCQETHSQTAIVCLLSKVFVHSNHKHLLQDSLHTVLW